MPKATMTDTAYNILSACSGEMAFAELWKQVAENMNIPEEKRSRKKASFYSEMMLDSRFASLKGNVWDLRKRRKFDEVHAVTEVDDEEEEELEENIEEEELDPASSEETY